jgi:hypothetical protein
MFYGHPINQLHTSPVPIGPGIAGRLLTAHVIAVQRALTGESLARHPSRAPAAMRLLTRVV